MLKYRNLLLSQLPRSEIAALQPFLEAVDLPLHTVLIRPDVAIEHVFFLESGLGSEVIVVEGEHRIEAGLVGREGVVGLPVVLDRRTSAHKTFMQIGGDGFRISATSFRLVIETSPVLRSLLLQYANDFMLQLGQTVLANGRYKIPARLARWILMSGDRIGGDEVPLTHEFLGLMLGVRRAGVSEALAVLEGQGLLRSAKANILIVDRKGLEAAAGPIYERIQSDASAFTAPMI